MDKSVYGYGYSPNASPNALPNAAPYSLGVSAVSASREMTAPEHVDRAINEALDVMKVAREMVNRLIGYAPESNISAPIEGASPSAVFPNMADRARLLSNEARTTLSELERLSRALP